jgi:hypothetical protein
VAELLERAQQLVAAGPYDARTSEIIAVHALIYPDREPVCDHCRAEQGKAYFAIKRWAEQQDSSSSISTNSTVKKSTSVARFKNANTIYTPHGLGVAYSNDNLTDKAARYIIANDPDAAALFSELPPAEEEGEDEQLTPAQQTAEKALVKAAHPVQTAPAGFDYAKLAKAMVDELERREGERTAEFEQALDNAASEQPPLTASTGGAADAGQETDNTDNSDSNTDTSDNTSNNSGTDADGEEKPVRLSRMNKEQLVATYTAELGQVPAEGLTNDELRDAIAEKRSSLQDPE